MFDWCIFDMQQHNLKTLLLNHFVLSFYFLKKKFCFETCFHDKSCYILYFVLTSWEGSTTQPIVIVRVDIVKYSSNFKPFLFLTLRGTFFVWVHISKGVWCLESRSCFGKLLSLTRSSPCQSGSRRIHDSCTGCNPCLG